MIDKYLTDKRKTRVKDPSFEFEESELEKMSIIIGTFSISSFKYNVFKLVGYNGSDVTYGWNGRMSGFTLHYSHFTDVIEEHGHAFPLSPGLIPIGLVSITDFELLIMTH